MKGFRFAVMFIFFTLLIAPTAQAVPMDLATFTPDGDVAVDLTAGTVTIDETSGYYSSYFYNDFFSVASDALWLSFDFDLSSEVEDYDWLVMMVNDGSVQLYDLEVTGTQTGSHVFDLTPYRGSAISLTFGLEADSSDLSLGSVARFSNFDISYAPVPEPGTFALIGLGLIGLAGFGRKMHN